MKRKRSHGLQINEKPGKVEQRSIRKRIQNYCEHMKDQGQSLGDVQEWFAHGLRMVTRD